MRRTDRFEIIPARAAVAFPALTPLTRRLARLCDGERTIEALAAHYSVPVDTVRPVLRMLVEMGVIGRAVRRSHERRSFRPEALDWARRRRAAQLVAPTPDPHGPDTFSSDEESFFSSSIDHLVEGTWRGQRSLQSA